MTARTRNRKILSVELLEDRFLMSGNALAGFNAFAINTGSYDPSRILVRFRPEVTAPASLAGTSVAQDIPLVPGLHEVTLDPGLTVENALAIYQRDPRVLYAEPDYYVQADAVPNDPGFPLQLPRGLAAIQAPGAWDVSTGGRSHTVVAVIDTGTDYNHPDLYENIWINQAEIPFSRRKNLVDVDRDGTIDFVDLKNPINQGVSKITDLNRDGRIDAADILAPMIMDVHGNDTGLGGWANGLAKDSDVQHRSDLVGWNFIAKSRTPFDDNGHGTHVAGILGARGNNGIGVAGVSWDVQIMPLKVLDAQGRGDIGTIIQGLGFAVAHGATISNNSYGGRVDLNNPNQVFLNQAFRDALENARTMGHVFVASAGNDALNNDVPNLASFPAAFRRDVDNVVAVAATDQNDQLAKFSNFGAATVDLAAPGVNILSTLPNNTYGLKSGTSMATPFVTGVLALVRDLHPDWNYRQIIDQVLRTADPLAALKGKTVTGGRLDVNAAVHFQRNPARDFDAHGRLIHERDFDAQHRLTKDTIWEYDAQGRLQTKTSWDYDTKGVNKRIAAWDYNEQGRVLSGTVWYADVPNHLSLITSEVYDAQGKVTTVTAWEYQKGSNKLLKITSTEYDNQGNRQFVLTWDYNALGQLIKTTQDELDVEGRLVQEWVWQ
jgi:YD repeat-containing protein